MLTLQFKSGTVKFYHQTTEDYQSSSSSARQRVLFLGFPDLL